MARTLTTQNNLRKLNVEIENEEFQVALEDYIFTRSEIKDTYNRIFGSLVILGFASTLFSLNGANNAPAQQSTGVATAPTAVSMVLIWLLPLAMHLVSAILIWLIYNDIILETHARKLTEYFKELFEKQELHEKLFYRYDKDSPLTTVLSLSSGYKPYKGLAIVAPGIGVAMELMVVISGFLLLREVDILMSTIYALVNGLIGIIFIFFWYDLQMNFRAYLKVTVSQTSTVAEASKASQDHPAIKKHTRTKRANEKHLGYKVIPRPTDLISKGSIFLLGFLLAWAFYGEDTKERTGLAEFLLGNRILGVEPGVPLSTQVIPVLAIGLVFFFVSEFLVQQAKLLWDDIRDDKLDKQRLTMNKRRALATESMSVHEATIHMPIRWALGLTLALLLDVDFFKLMLAVTILQVIYEFYAKPSSGKYPLIWLLLVSLGLPLRFLAGMLALDANIFRFEVILFAVLIYFSSVGNLATWMVVEIDEKTSKNEQQQHFQDRKQAWIFKGDIGPLLQRWGLIASLVCGCMLGNYILTSEAGESWFQKIGSGLALTNSLFHASEPGQYFVALALAGLIAISIGAILLMPLTWLLERMIPVMSHAPLKRKTTDKWNLTGNKEKIMGLLMALVFAALAILFWDRKLSEAMIAVLVPLLFLFLYEAITYREYSFANLLENLPVLKGLWGGFLFDSTSGIKFHEVLTVTLNANIDSEALRAAIAQRQALSNTRR